MTETTTFQSQFAQLQRADDDRDPAFLQFAVALAEELRAESDADFVRLGALADMVTAPRIGHQRMTLVEFANDIGAGRTSLSQYRSAVRFFGGHDDTAKLLTDMPNLSFAHLRSAMRLKDYEDAREVLAQWSADGTSTGAAHIEINERIGKPVKPAALWDGGAIIESLELREGGARLIIELEVGDFDPVILKQALIDSWDKRGAGLQTHLVVKKDA